ncbi:MAG: MFS transporter [Chitinophagaceae bacterium]
MKEKIFSTYQRFLITMLTILNFMVFLDFVVLTPLGPVILKELAITPRQYGWVVSVYAFSAAISGFLAAGFADKFDRKKMLLVFLVGFTIGTAMRAIAPNYNFFVIARIFSGLFGGVLGGISFAIITDLFKIEVRGRVMGFVQMGPGLSQILGFPLALIAAKYLGWHSAFWMVVILAIIYFLIVLIYIKPIDEHLKNPSRNNAVTHLFKTIVKPQYILAYALSLVLMLAGWMILPFNAVFISNNAGVSMQQLPFVYLITGIFTFTTAPFIGKGIDYFGKFKFLVAVSILSLIIIPIYTHLMSTPLWLTILCNIIFFIMLSARMISVNSLITVIPHPQDRGAFMSINASFQQIAGGFAAGITGLIVTQSPDGKILNYDILGFCLMATVILVLVLAYFFNKILKK